MPWETLPDKAAEYRTRAGDARRKADASPDPRTRETLMQTADIWERMARYEDECPTHLQGVLKAG